MRYLFLVVFSLLPFICGAQDSAQLRSQINTLCAKGFFGRGYVGKGMHKAGSYVAEQFRVFGLKPVGSSFEQPFSYPANTFPGVIDVRVGDRPLKPGEDYLVHPASSGIQIESKKLRVFDGFSFVQSTTADNRKKKWNSQLKKFSKKKFVYQISKIDSLLQKDEFSKRREVYAQFPAGVYLVPLRVKPIWSVSGAAMPATVIELYDSTLLLKKNEKVTVTVINQELEKFKAENIIGMVPGTLHPDSFIVITAHYDHLGKMGNRTLFPGASDNASGTAMLLELARYYAANPQPFSIAFIAFAGEEAGLKGSEFFTEHPVFPLANIKFLINLDILGDASGGISVVNGLEHEQQFQLLKMQNKEEIIGTVLPEIRQGGAAANSDHYHFTQKGVPAFFIFSIGGKGYYHDIWDTPQNLSLKNIPETAILLKNFIAALQ